MGSNENRSRLRRGARSEAGRAPFGVISRRQLLEIGLGAGAIDCRLRSGRYVARHAGVYAVAPVREDPLAWAMAAVLACGPTALLSHCSAAALWEVGTGWSWPAEVTVASDRGPQGVRVHRSLTLISADRRRRHGIWEFHRDRQAFVSDRERDAHHLAHGYVTVRITWERLRDESPREAARLRQIIQARA